MVETDGLTRELGAFAPDHGVPEVLPEGPVDQFAHIADGVESRIGSKTHIELGLISLRPSKTVSLVILVRVLLDQLSKITIICYFCKTKLRHKI